MINFNIFGHYRRHVTTNGEELGTLFWWVLEPIAQYSGREHTSQMSYYITIYTQVDIVKFWQLRPILKSLIDKQSTINRLKNSYNWTLHCCTEKWAQCHVIIGPLYVDTLLSLLTQCYSIQATGDVRWLWRSNDHIQGSVFNELLVQGFMKEWWAMISHTEVPWQ